jgi:CRISPR system Cascade subunit CasC
MCIEIHVLQNFAPSNLNRDDTGSPKDAEFGGHRRARISSQCSKRAVREYFEKHDLIPAANRAVRTKRLVSQVVEKLTAPERPASDVQAAIDALLAGVEIGLTDELKTDYLLYIGQAEIDGLVKHIKDNWRAVSESGRKVSEYRAANAQKEGNNRKKGKVLKEALQKLVSKELVTFVRGRLDGGKAADLALFGRMLADLPERNVDAACQVAHAISTNKIHSMEMDYYTAVDDLKPEDTAGADMIGTVEFNSACFYRYATLDVAELLGGYRDEKKTRPFGLQGDAELAKTTVTAFLKAFVHAIPTGKQNSFAAHNAPSLVFAVVRDGPPVSLANAFVKPIHPGRDGDLVALSIKAMDDYYGRLLAMYGDRGRKASAVCQMDGIQLKHLKDSVESVEQLIATVLKAASPAGGTA